MPTSAATDAALFAMPGDAALRDAAHAWSRSLAAERRMSDNTVEAYERDLRQFLHHLDARAGTPTIAAIVALKPRDVRA
ncbi:recombinase XerC, partial [Methylobacterium sp. WL122]